MSRERSDRGYLWVATSVAGQSLAGSVSAAAVLWAGTLSVSSLELGVGAVSSGGCPPVVVTRRESGGDGAPQVQRLEVQGADVRYAAITGYEPSAGRALV